MERGGGGKERERGEIGKERKGETETERQRERETERWVGTDIIRLDVHHVMRPLSIAGRGSSLTVSHLVGFFT